MSNKKTIKKSPKIKSSKRQVEQMVRLTDNNRTYLIYMGNNDYFIQRTMPSVATESQLSNTEKVICTLCDYIIKST